jgi:co-chaperonin GroES (HSP10)
MKVLGNRLLIEFVEEKVEESSDIIVVPGKKEASDRAKVVAVGSEVEKDLVEVDDIVVVDRYYGNTVDVDGRICNVVEFDSVLVVL